MNDRNENRPGYKKSKVGWIPEDWKAMPLGSFGLFSKGKGISNSAKKETGVPCITYGEIYAKYDFIVQEIQSFIDIETAKSSQRIKKNDVLFAGSGETLDEIGKCVAFIKDGEAYAGGDIIIFSPNGVDSVYLSYALNSDLITKEKRKLGQGHSVVHIYSSVLKTLNTPLPPFIEQKKIAQILSTWDETIDQTRKLIEVKKRLKKGLMQQLLTGRKRLTPYAKQNGRRYYRFFDLPEDWECSQIKEIAKECSGRNRNREDLPVLSCSKYTGFVESAEYFGKRVFSEDTSNYKIIRRGQFGFPSNHVEEGSIGLLQKQEKGLVSPIYTVFECDEKVVPEYLYAVFKSDTFRHIFKVSTNASVDRRGSLRWKEFSLIHVPLPIVEEQKAIADVLKTVDDDIAQSELKLSALEKQKRGLMQKLLTGEVRVKV